MSEKFKKEQLPAEPEKLAKNWHLDVDNQAMSGNIHSKITNVCDWLELFPEPINVDYKAIKAKAETCNQKKEEKNKESEKIGTDLFAIISKYLREDLKHVNLQAVNESFNKDLHILEINLITMTEVIDRTLEEFSQKLRTLNDDFSNKIINKHNHNIQFILLDLINLKEEISFLLSELSLNTLNDILAKKKHMEDKCDKLKNQLDNVLQKIEKELLKK